MISTDIRTQVHDALRDLATRCNGASSRDGAGFNKMDAYNGKQMAAQDELSPSDVLYGAKMLQKYHNQITVPDLVAAKRYFAINGPRRGDSITAIEEADNDDSYEGEQMEEEHVQPTTTEKSAIVLSAEQQALFKVMEGTRQHLFITGRAGTGKSVLLRHFRENTSKRVVVAAPTGIAALNVRGQTIHSLFRLPPQFHRKGSLAPNSRICSVLKRIDAIVIDEVSMVRADLLDAIDERLREAHRNDLPFGGVQLIMFGDVYQLPPVVEEGLVPYFEHTYGGYFFFHASVWDKTEFKIYELEQVFRQKDPVFKEVLNAVRDGSVSDDQIKQLNVRCGVSIPKEGTITLATTNSLVTTINQRRLDQLPGKAFEYRAMITGEMKRGTFPTEEIIQLKVGAQVVLLQNDKDKRWVNGTVATISALKKEAIAVHVDGIDYGLEQTTWEEIRYEYDPAAGKVKEEVVSSFTQYPIRLAWAMTIHKSQGQTYESIALDLTTATFAPGQLYVALSRATSLEGLYLKMPVIRKHIIVEPKVAAFMARREAIVLSVEETQTVDSKPVATTPESSFSPLVASFFDAAIQDAANRGFMVQAVVADPIIESVAVEPTITIAEQPIEVAQSAKITVDIEQLCPTQKTARSQGNKGQSKGLVGVAYNFPPDVAEKLKIAADLILEKHGKKLDKSAYVAGRVMNQYLPLDELIAQLQK